jgi:hypothetical protein
MTQTNLINFTIKVKEYVKKNWGSPFIVVFILLLLSTAVSLSAGLSSLANAAAVYAYYAVVAGVILQFASFLKFRKTDGEVI